LDIDGSSPQGFYSIVRVSGFASRVFDITNPSSTITLAHLFMIGGSAAQGGGIYDAGGTVNLVQDVLESCFARGVDADPKVPGSTGGDGLGGGIYEAGGPLTLTQCSLEGTDAIGGNGVLDGSAFAPGGNGLGGAIYNADGMLTLAIVSPTQIRR